MGGHSGQRRHQHRPHGTGLDNTKEYDFKVRALAGSGDTLVSGAESNKATAGPADQAPALTGTIADQELTQGAAFTSTALPAATGGDAPLAYSVADLPDGITLNAERKLTGTPSAPLAKTQLTHKVTDAAGDANNANDDDTPDTATLTFNISVAPQKPANFTAAAGDAKVTLSWTAIAGVSGWEVKQGSSSWAAITGSGASTDSHTVTGLTNGTSYTFGVRALVGSGDTLVNGAESDAETATPSADLAPAVASVTDKTFTQGAAVDETLPPAVGGDSHPDYTYTLTPDVSGVGLAFTAATRKLGGTPSAPKAKVAYTYTAAETSDPDGTTESATKTFTIGIQPNKPAGSAAAAGDGEAALSWTAIAGVSGWEYQRDSGNWAAITPSSSATNSHTVTGLTNGTQYTFKVRSYVGTGDAPVDGAETATPSADLAPALASVADKIYTQGTAADDTLPAATGGDSHPDYTYTLTPDASRSGLAFTASTRKLGGTPTAAKAKTAYTYTATETSDPDGTTESATKTFTIGIQPRKPAGSAAAAGNGLAVLSWTANAGVTGWEYQQDNGAWTAITASGANTTSHTVTGLTNGTTHTFKVRAHAGDAGASPSTRVDGAQSDAKTATPAAPPVTGGGGGPVGPVGQ